jgi:hypothetical protein
MATRKTGGRASRARSSGAAAGEKSWKRLTKSIDTADDALKDLRKELGRGGKEVLKDLERALKDSRKGIGSAQKTAAKNAEKLQRVVTTGRKTKPPAKSGGSRSTAKKSTARKSTAKRSSSSRSGGSRSTAKRSSSSSRSGGRGSRSR